MNFSSSWKHFLLPLSLCTGCSFFIESPILTPHPHSQSLMCTWETVIHTSSPHSRQLQALRSLPGYPRLTLTLFSVYHCALFDSSSKPIAACIYVSFCSSLGCEALGPGTTSFRFDIQECNTASVTRSVKNIYIMNKWVSKVQFDRTFKREQQGE